MAIFLRFNLHFKDHFFQQRSNCPAHCKIEALEKIYSSKEGFPSNQSKHQFLLALLATWQREAEHACSRISKKQFAPSEGKGAPGA